jgi:hypothetical protein
MDAVNVKNPGGERLETLLKKTKCAAGGCREAWELVYLDGYGKLF